MDEDDLPSLGSQLFQKSLRCWLRRPDRNRLNIRGGQICGHRCKVGLFHVMF